MFCLTYITQESSTSGQVNRDSGRLSTWQAQKHRMQYKHAFMAAFRFYSSFIPAQNLSAKCSWWLDKRDKDKVEDDGEIIQVYPTTD